MFKTSFDRSPFSFVVFVNYLSTAVKIFVFGFMRRSKVLEVQQIQRSSAWSKTKVNEGKIWISIVYTNVNTTQTISCSRCLFAIFKSTVDLEILHLLFDLDYNRIPIEIYIFTMTSWSWSYRTSGEEISYISLSLNNRSLIILKRYYSLLILYYQNYIFYLLYLSNNWMLLS